MQINSYSLESEKYWVNYYEITVRCWRKELILNNRVWNKLYQKNHF